MAITNWNRWVGVIDNDDEPLIYVVYERSCVCSHMGVVKEVERFSSLEKAEALVNKSK
jgi:hypothetical protein